MLSNLYFQCPCNRVQAVPYHQPCPFNVAAMDASHSQAMAYALAAKKWSLLEESRGRGPPAQQYNFLFCGRSLKELSAGRSKYMITNIRICMWSQ